MLTTSDLEIALGVGEGTAANWVRTGRLAPDHTIEMGSRTYCYFLKERVDGIRVQFGIRERTAATRKDDFLEFVSEMDMSSSYKPVMLVALLDCADADGRCRIEDLASRFREFYVERANAGLVTEFGRNRMRNAAALSSAEVAQVLIEMPFEKFERRGFLHRDRDVAWVRFDRVLWRRLGEDGLAQVRGLAEQAIARYFQRGADEDGDSTR